MPLIVHLIAPTAADHAAVEALSTAVGDGQVVETIYTRQGIEQAIDAARTQFETTPEYEQEPDSHYDFDFDLETGSVDRNDRGPVELHADCDGSSSKNRGRLDGGRSLVTEVSTNSTSCNGLDANCQIAFSGSFNGKQGALTAGHCMLHGAASASSFAMLRSAQVEPNDSCCAFIPSRPD